MRMRDGQSLDLHMVSLKEDRFMQFTASSGIKFQSLMAAEKRVFGCVCSTNR